MCNINSMDDRDHSFDLVEHFDDIHRHLNNDDIRNSDYLLLLRKQLTDVITRIDLMLLRDHCEQSKVQEFFKQQ